MDTIGNTHDANIHLHCLNLSRLGVGGILPKDVADGTFTRRTIGTNDKLLEQLIGKKKAKAHIAAKQHAERLGAQPQPKQGRQVTKKEESEDEEEGRAATFKSKRRRVAKQKPDPAGDEDDVDDAAKPPVPAEESRKDETPAPKEDDDLSDPGPTASKPRSKNSRGRAKPTSYLDELLAERSKKKKAKNKT
jgi:hypothetical protein